MKRVLVLNGDSYVGKHVARSFYNSREYEVEVTLSTFLKRAPLCENNQITLPGVYNRPTTTEVPPDMRDYVSRVVINHNESPDDFRLKVLENDVIIAILEDDAYEAECAARVLLGSHYEVEKTFVLVSSMFTWAETLNSERAKVRAERRKEAALQRAAELEFEDDNDIMDTSANGPNSENKDDSDDEEDYSDEELVPSRVFSEEDYAQRVPDPRYQHWKLLERLVKHANSETLHTNVIAAGLPYGDGEGPLEDLLRAAWLHQPLEPLLPFRYDRFKRRRHRDNVVPMIHVQDLSAIIYEVGSAYDVLEERYLFAVDQGNCTVQQILDALKAGFGDGVAWGEIPTIAAEDEKLAFEIANPDRAKSAMTKTDAAAAGEQIERNRTTSGYWPHFLLDVRAKPGKVLTLYEEDRWMALDGFTENFDKVLYQFRKVRCLPPCKIMVTGPPLSGSETVAMLLAAAYCVPVVTAELAAAAFERYVVELREELRSLLLKRLERRRIRAHERRRREKQEAEEERQRLKQEANEEEEEEEDYDNEDDKDSESGGGNDSTKEASDDVASRLSEVFSEDHFEFDLSAKLTDAYLLGELDEFGDGSIEESGEDEDLVIDDDAEELSTTQRCIRLKMVERDRAEKVRIQMLRDRYRLAFKVLSMKLVDGSLPHPPVELDRLSLDEEDDVGPGKEGRAASARRRGDGDDEEEPDDSDGDGSSGAEAEGEDEGEEEENKSDSSDSSDSTMTADHPNESRDQGGASASRPAGDGPAHGEGAQAETTQYLDEAIAFFVRWRLRRADCRHQGYVLQGYPRTVNEARLVFRATAAEGAGADGHDGEEGARLPVPPPADVDFPLVDVMAMSDEERAAYEARLRGGEAGPPPSAEDEDADDVLRPVSEALFPAHVVVLSQGDGLVAAAAAAALAGGGPAVCGGSDEAAWLRFFDGAPQDYGGGSQPMTTAAGGDLQARLSAYRAHHAYPARGPAAAPARSLLSWLQSVGSTAAAGATAEPVVVHAAKPLREDGEEEDEAAGEPDGDGAAAASAARTAQLTIVEAPCRPAAVATHELREALRTARFQLIQGLSGRPLRGLDLGREVFSLSHDQPDGRESVAFREAALEYASHPTPGRPVPLSPDAELPLLELVDRLRHTLLDKDFMPHVERQPAAKSAPKFDMDVSFGFFKSADVQVASMDGNSEVTPNVHHFMDESFQSLLTISEKELNPSRLIGQELLTIRQLNIAEEHINYQTMAQMPMETYLVTYVLPSLTPALAEIVKLRPDDPITVLADILYDYKRRKDV